MTDTSPFALHGCPHRQFLLCELILFFMAIDLRGLSALLFAGSACPYSRKIFTFAFFTGTYLIVFSIVEQATANFTFLWDPPTFYKLDI